MEKNIHLLLLAFPGRRTPTGLDELKTLQIP
jgi:hypothetical protein